VSAFLNCHFSCLSFLDGRQTFCAYMSGLCSWLDLEFRRSAGKKKSRLREALEAKSGGGLMHWRRLIIASAHAESQGSFFGIGHCVRPVGWTLQQISGQLWLQGNIVMKHVR